MANQPNQISLRLTGFEQLGAIAEMETQPHARNFVHSCSLEKHQLQFADPNITYLNIESNGELAGYFILVKETATESVEFGRIVILESYRGIGQESIQQMEFFCRKKLNAKRIWLDVYEDNHRGMHIYEKLGYKRFKEKQSGERKLFFYEKFFNEQHQA